MKQLIRISLGLAVLFFTSCTNTSQEDKLALQLSQSKNFIQLELISKKMMDQVNQIKKTLNYPIHLKTWTLYQDEILFYNIYYAQKIFRRLVGKWQKRRKI